MAKASILEFHPLFPAYAQLDDFHLTDYPSLAEFFNQAEPWLAASWQPLADFLRYIGRHKSPTTYERFRSELERFLLWLNALGAKRPDQVNKADILAYVDFSVKPKKTWCGDSRQARFHLRGGLYRANPRWRPCNLDGRQQANRLSQESLNALFTALNAWFKYALEEGLVEKNPVPTAKRDCRHRLRDSQIKPVRRLSEEQWQSVLASAKQMADRDAQYERHLFLIAALKSLYLRISEFSQRDGWLPVFGHFWHDGEFWWLKVLGKGNKLRDISVPEAFLPYLHRYRRSRHLPDWPAPQEQQVIMHKLKGPGAPTSRHLRRMVQEVFDYSIDTLKRAGRTEDAQQLSTATSHWLRHTGASMDVENGRNIKHLADDLGHASIATTDRVYVQSDARLRAKSGVKRSV